MSKGIFITGTDTGVGKTIVSAVIIRALIKKGINTGAMKPVETGCKKSEVKSQKSEIKSGNELLIPSDGMFLKEMAGMDDSIDLITPVRFEQPLAPMVASELENRPVELENIFSSYKYLAKKYGFMVVEGAGGLLVPVAKLQIPKPKACYFMVDLIKDLGLPVIIVATPALGTINHTLLTINEAQRQGVRVAGVIINHPVPPENSIAEKTNPDVLKELCPAPVLGVLPYIERITPESIESAAGCIAGMTLKNPKSRKTTR